jgi:hypothetical protein
MHYNLLTKVYSKSEGLSKLVEENEEVARVFMWTFNFVLSKVKQDKKNISDLRIGKLEKVEGTENKFKIKVKFNG